VEIGRCRRGEAQSAKPRQAARESDVLGLRHLRDWHKHATGSRPTLANRKSSQMPASISTLGQALPAFRAAPGSGDRFGIGSLASRAVAALDTVRRASESERFNGCHRGARRAASITYEPARLLAQLVNVPYRIPLFSLVRYLHTPGDLSESDGQSGPGGSSGMFVWKRCGAG
jgi:hypothetical protein